MKNNNNSNRCWIAILILVIVAIIFWSIMNPPSFLACSRDANRFKDISNISAVIGIYQANNSDFFTLPTAHYSSDTNDINRFEIDGRGWLPMNFKSVSTGLPITALPVDPINTDHYRYIVGFDFTNKTYEVDCIFESSLNKEKMRKDGGNNPNVYELGTDLKILK